MVSYEPYTLEMHPGHDHRNANGMSRATKDCKFLECDACAHCRDSESVDSDTPMAEDR